MSYKDKIDYKIANFVFVVAVCATALSLPLWAFFSAAGYAELSGLFRSVSAGAGTLSATSLLVGWLTMQEPK